MESVLKRASGAIRRLAPPTLRYRKSTGANEPKSNRVAFTTASDARAIIFPPTEKFGNGAQDCKGPSGEAAINDGALSAEPSLDSLLFFRRPLLHQGDALRKGWVVVRLFETSATVRKLDANSCLPVGSQANHATVQCGKVEASVCRDHAVEDGG